MLTHFVIGIRFQEITGESDEDAWLAPCILAEKAVPQGKTKDLFNEKWLTHSLTT